MNFRRLFLAGALAAAAFGPALAQSWPAKPIHFIVPFPAGGPTDQLTRKLGQQLTSALGQPVIVENVAGAMGSIGLAKVARAAPDGYTFGLGAHSTHAIAPHVTKLSYDPVTDLQPVGGLVTFAYVLITNPAEPAKDVAGLVARSKTMPGGISFGSSGPGGGNHILGEMLALQTGAVLNHIPYKGTAPAQQDVMAGHISFMFDVVSTAAPLIKAGKLGALGVTGKTRSRTLPTVPAIAESVADFGGLGWFAFFGPKGLPPEITQRMNVEINKIYRSPDFTAFLDSAGYEPVIGSPEQLGKTVASDYAAWGKAIKAAGIKPE
jgi:tripartite-type tricarboxylate transporter receptor subunit TctC